MSEHTRTYLSKLDNIKRNLNKTKYMECNRVYYNTLNALKRIKRIK